MSPGRRPRRKGNFAPESEEDSGDDQHDAKNQQDLAQVGVRASRSHTAILIILDRGKSNARNSYRGNEAPNLREIAPWEQSPQLGVKTRLGGNAV